MPIWRQAIYQSNDDKDLSCIYAVTRGNKLIALLKFHVIYSKTSIKCAPNIKLIEEIIEKNSSNCEKASNLRHKFNAFLTI